MSLEGQDDHIIAKSGDKIMLIRPGASRRLAFRGTPGGRVAVRVGAKRGPNLGDTEEPTGGPGLVTGFDGIMVSLNELAFARTARDGRSRRTGTSAEAEAILFEAMSAAPLGADPPGGNTPSTGTATAAPQPAFRPRVGLSMDSFGGLVVVGPEDERPPDLPPPPAIPVEVSVAVRGGSVLKSETLEIDFPSMPRLVAGPFPGHDVVDVTYRNPNSFPLLVYTFVHVQNEIDVTATVLRQPMLERVFGNALLWLAPTISVRNGRLHFSFSQEAMSILGLEPATADIGVDADVSATIEPVEFDLLTHEQAIRIVVGALKEEIDRRLSSFPTPVKLPPDFVAQAVTAYFSPTRSIRFLLDDELGLPEFVWKAALDRHPMLKDRVENARGDDVALRFDLRLTSIQAEVSVLSINVDTVTASLIVVLRSGRKHLPHPVASLRDDFVPGGFLIPRFDLSVDIGKIDANLDLGGGIFTKPFEFAAEEALEELADWFKDDFEDKAVDLGMTFLEESRLVIGELATEMVRQIANRDHVFRRLRVDSGGWVIETMDPAQLAVPFVPPDPVDHRFDDINVSLPPVDPIDGPMPADATARLGRVDHLVFLMMENRSFDHMLGYLSHPGHTARTDVDGLDGQPVRLGGAFEGTTAVPQPGPRNSFIPDPGHGVETVAEQINEGAMDGFVSEFVLRLEGNDAINPKGNLMDPERILRFHTAAQLPTYDRLTRTDMVLDRWFCTIPGATYPNRFCYYAGFTPKLSNREIFEDAGYQRELTFVDLLDHEGVDWVCYESDFTFLRVFEPYRLDITRIRPIEDFFARRDALPPVTLLDPDYVGTPSAGPSNDDHPPADITEGQAFVRRVIEKLQDLPSWPRTMLVITYDEHGGFADHVPPPGTPASAFPPDSAGTPSVPLGHPGVASYGVRVPTFVVSPVITAGGVGHQIYDHASIFRTVIERFMPNLRDSAVLPERVRRARHLGELIEPGPATTASVGRFDTVALAAPAPAPDAVIHRDSDDHRPRFAPPPSLDDFDFFIERFGNPIGPR